MISKYNWFLLLPVNLFLSFPIYEVRELRDYLQINLHIPDYVYVCYILMFVLAYSIINFKFYNKIPNKVFFMYNLVNFAISWIICLLFDRILENWEWFFYALTSTQHHFVIWLMLMLYQCLVRFFAWIKFT